MKHLTLVLSIFASIPAFAQAPKYPKPVIKEIVTKCGYNKVVATGIGSKKETVNLKVVMFKDFVYNKKEEKWIEKTMLQRYQQEPGKREWNFVALEYLKGFVQDKTKAIQEKETRGPFTNDVVSFVISPSDWTINSNPNVLKSLSFYTFAKDNKGRSVQISDYTFDSDCKN